MLNNQSDEVHVNKSDLPNNTMTATSNHTSVATSSVSSSIVFFPGFCLVSTWSMRSTTLQHQYHGILQQRNHVLPFILMTCYYTSSVTSVRVARFAHSWCAQHKSRADSTQTYVNFLFHSTLGYPHDNIVIQMLMQGLWPTIKLASSTHMAIQMASTTRVHFKTTANLHFHRHSHGQIHKTQRCTISIIPK
jgi:hypothetical protein